VPARGGKGVPPRESDRESDPPPSPANYRAADELREMKNACRLIAARRPGDKAEEQLQRKRVRGKREDPGS